MERTEAIELVKKLQRSLPEEEKAYLADLITALKSKKGPEDPDEYADLLLGYSEEYEDVDEELCCKLANYLTEEF